MRALVVVVVAATLAAGCGSHHARNVDRVRILEALRRSPYTYFAFRNPLYWGEAVGFAVHDVRISKRDGRWAAAAIVPVTASATRAGRTQRVLLESTGGRWRVVRADAYGGADPCALAPKGVIEELYGSCDETETAADARAVAAVTLIFAPLAARAPTPAERRAIVAATRARHFAHGEGRCVRYHVRVSKIDGRYAMVTYTFAKPYTGCAIGDGRTYMQLENGRWRVKGDASDAAPCNWLPPGVARSLDRACVIYGSRES